MKTKDAVNIIYKEFPGLKEENYSQYSTLVSLLVKYGADESRPVEKLVMPKIAGDYLQNNMPEDYEIADEPTISDVYDNDKNIIENELYMIIPLRKKQ